jgi:hypothetical protein
MATAVAFSFPSVRRWLGFVSKEAIRVEGGESAVQTIATPLDAFCPGAHNGQVITKNHPALPVGKELYSALWKKEKTA